jgi:hypothetical protein
MTMRGAVTVVRGAALTDGAEGLCYDDADDDDGALCRLIP